MWLLFTVKHFKIRTVLALAFALLLTGFVCAQNDSLTAKNLDAYIVTAQRVPVVSSELMRVVQVISHNEIEKMPANDIAGLLESVSGVDVRRRGSSGMQADISVRGGTFDQVMVLLNGVSITDPQTGHHNLNIPVDISSIKRIEVLKGSGARLYGPNAFNGVINIITDTKNENRASATFTAGEYGYLEGAVSGRINHKKFTNYLSVNGIRTDGFTHNTDFNNLQLFNHNVFSSALYDIENQLGYSNKGFGANSFYSPRYPDQYEAIETFFASAKATPKGPLKITPTLFWRRQYDHFELFRHEAPAWYTSHNNHMTDVAGLQLNWERSGRMSRTSLGADFRYESIYSNVLGNSLDEPATSVLKKNISYTRFYNRSGISLMGEHSLYWERFSLSGGALMYYNTARKGKVSFFPGLDLAFLAQKHIKFFANVHRTLRLPTFTDLFYTGPDNNGNPFLKPEEAISAEAGARLIYEKLSIECSTFKRLGKNMIDWVKTPGDTRWQAMNHTSVNISGIETTAAFSFGAGNESTPNTIKLGYTFLTSDTLSGELISHYVLDYLRHKLTFSLNLQIGKKTGISLNVVWQDRAGGFMLYENGLFTSTVAYKPVWIADAKLFRQMGNFKFFVDATNFTNTPLVSIANVPQAGRWVRGGVSFNFQNIKK